MTRLLIIGPQGSGKGTQGVRIAAALGIPAISTGDVFRAAIAAGSELGARVKGVIEAGDLVSDDLTSAVVRERLSQSDASKGFLLDGYPRNITQSRHLDAYLDQSDEALDAVILLDVPTEESIARMKMRAHEQGRTDDTPEVIARRLEIYERETAPITSEYEARGLLITVDGIGSPYQITDRIIASLAARKSAASPL